MHLLRKLQYLGRAPDVRCVGLYFSYYMYVVPTVSRNQIWVLNYQWRDSVAPEYSKSESAGANITKPDCSAADYRGALRLRGIVSS